MHIVGQVGAMLHSNMRTLLDVAFSTSPASSVEWRFLDRDELSRLLPQPYWENDHRITLWTVRLQ